MARGFGTTYGVGASDMVTTAFTGAATGPRSVFIRSFRNGAGGGGFGRFYEVGNVEILFEGDSDKTFRMNRTFGGSVASWSAPLGSDGAWHTYGMSYDCSNNLNAPIFYLDGVLQITTVIVTRGGSANASSAALTIGARASDNLRTWNGMHAEFAVWDGVLLTDAEHAELAAGKPPFMVRPASLSEYVPLLRDLVSYKLAAPSATGTVIQPHPRVFMPRRRHIITAPAAVSGVTGILATTELGDTFVASGFLTHTGQLVLTEAGDAFAALGTLTTIGTLALTESGDIALFQGNVGAEVTGILNATENVDIAAFIGHSTHTGIVVVAESGDVFVAFGTSGDVTPGVGGGWRFKRLALKIGLGL